MYEKQRRIKLAFLITGFTLFFLIAIGVFGCYGVPKSENQAAFPSEAVYPGARTSLPVPGLASDTIVPSEVEMLKNYEEQLKGKNLDEVARNSIETKIAIYSRIVTQQAMIKKTAVSASFPTQLPMTDVSLPTGLHEGGTSDFHTWEAIIKNIWAQYVNNIEHVVVYARELSSRTKFPGRGVVFVLRRTPDKRVQSFNQYLLPEGTGWVRISEIKGDYLVLISNEGNIFYFYVPGQRFVSSLTEVVSTVTPLPTARPLPTLGPLPTIRPYPYP